MVVTDDGTCVFNAEFELFFKGKGIKHTTSAPHHPASNGLAEAAIEVVKRCLKKVKEGSMSSRLAKVLLIYRITPQSMTGLTSAEQLLGK